MKKIHRPTTGQAFEFTCLPSDAVPDPTTVASGVLILRGPGVESVELSATIVKSTTSVVLTHPCDPTAGEAQEVGTYALWAVLTLGSGDIVVANNNPHHFQVVEDFVDTVSC